MCEHKRKSPRKENPKILRNNLSFRNDVSGGKNQIAMTLQANEEIFKERMKTKAIERELEKIRTRNKTLERRQKEIVSKMRNLRKIQVDSDSIQRWNDHVDDLEIIVEDAELFLDSVVDSHKGKQKLFFGDSRISQQSKADQRGLIDDRNADVVLAPLFSKLEEIDLSGFDDDEIKEIDQEVAQLYNPIECIISFVGSFERALAKSRGQVEELKSETGGRSGRSDSKSDCGRRVSDEVARSSG